MEVEIQKINIDQVVLTFVNDPSSGLKEIDTLAGLIKKLTRESRKVGFKKSFDADEQELINELYEYQKKNLKDIKTYYLNEKFMEASMETANIEKLWDYSIYYKIQQLEDMIDKFRFVQVFKPDVNWLPMAANYIKKVNKNIRLDLRWYQHSKIETKI